MNLSLLVAGALLATSLTAHPEAAEAPEANDPASSFAKLKALAADRPLIVAHRGDSSEFPENTVPAFESAIFQSAEIIELDVYKTIDGHWVCFHDKTLDRTTNAEVVFGAAGLKIEERTLMELRRLDAGVWKGERFVGVRIPTLEEALEAILPSATPLIERKGGDAESLATFLKARGELDQVIVQAFDWAFLEDFRGHAPTATLGALGSGEMTIDHVARFREHAFHLVHWRGSDVTTEMLRVLHKREFLTMVYTLNTDVEYAGAAVLGVGGITTDDPNHLRGRIQAGFAIRRGR